MHPVTITRESIPPFVPCPMEAPAHRNVLMFRVSLKPLGRNQPHQWQGWAADATDATFRAVDDARQRWQGYSFVVNAVHQVGM